VKRIGDDKQIFIATEHPFLDAAIEAKNREAVGDFIRSLREIHDLAINTALKSCGVIALILVILGFLIPSGVGKFLLAFVLLIICYFFLKGIEFKDLKIQEIEKILVS
jgi:uncharacterized membrane protein YbaN (DUF454 family)